MKGDGAVGTQSQGGRGEVASGSGKLLVLPPVCFCWGCQQEELGWTPWLVERQAEGGWQCRVPTEGAGDAGRVQVPSLFEKHTVGPW